MSNREIFNKVLNDIKTNELEQSKYGEDMYNLSVKKEKIAATIVLEEKLLNDTTWVLSYDDNNQPFLKANKSINEMNRLTEIAWQGYHASLMLLTGISIEFNDGEIRLNFKDASNMTKFITKYGLTCDYSCVNKKIKFFEEQLAALKEIKASLAI